LFTHVDNHIPPARIINGLRKATLAPP
jgi:hypothetical protein